MPPKFDLAERPAAPPRQGQRSAVEVVGLKLREAPTGLEGRSVTRPELLVDQLDAGPLPVVEALSEIHAVLDRVDLGVDVATPALQSALQSALLETVRAVNRLEAVKLRVMTAAKAAEVGRARGFSDTGSWAGSVARSGARVGAADERLAEELAERLPITKSALELGDLSAAHANVIATALSTVPTDVSTDERARLEASLTQVARRVDPATLRREARRLLRFIDRPVAVVDAHENDVVTTEEEAAVARATLSMRPNLDGTTSGWFTLPDMQAAILQKAVEQICSPRRHYLRERAAGRFTDSDTIRENSPAWNHKRGLALMEICEHLSTERLGGKVAATVVVSISLDHLRESSGVGHSDTGHALSAGHIRRLACGAGIVPIILNGRSEPVDVGRSQRFFTEAQRIAMATKYTECAAEGCDRPFAWTEIHHEHAWDHGGVTDLANAIPLCGSHHHLIHDKHYKHQIRTGPPTEDSDRSRVGARRGSVKCVTFRQRT